MSIKILNTSVCVYYIVKNNEKIIALLKPKTPQGRCEKWARNSYIKKTMHHKLICWEILKTNKNQLVSKLICTVSKKALSTSNTVVPL